LGIAFGFDFPVGTHQDCRALIGSGPCRTSHRISSTFPLTSRQRRIMHACNGCLVGCRLLVGQQQHGSKALVKSPGHCACSGRNRVVRGSGKQTILAQKSIKTVLETVVSACDNVCKSTLEHTKLLAHSLWAHASVLDQTWTAQQKWIRGCPALDQEGLSPTVPNHSLDMQRQCRLAALTDWKRVFAQCQELCGQLDSDESVVKESLDARLGRVWSDQLSGSSLDASSIHEIPAAQFCKARKSEIAQACANFVRVTHCQSGRNRNANSNISMGPLLVLSCGTQSDACK
jgi:hypothetical protein